MTNVLKRPRSLRKSLLGIAVFLVLPVIVACGDKKKTVVADAAPVTTAAVDAWVNIAPEEDAADAADAADTAKKVGLGVSTNVTRLRQCCGQLRIQARPILATPEGQALLTAATQCDAMASQAGGGGANVPELGLLRTALAGRNLPAICRGF